MGVFESIGTASDRVMGKLITGLEIEFGRPVASALAHRFLEAEEVDFLWDARVQERWLGSYDGGFDQDDIVLDRIAILGRLDGTWFVATMIVDGDGHPHGMLGKRAFATRNAADEAYGIAH